MLQVHCLNLSIYDTNVRFRDLQDNEKNLRAFDLTLNLYDFAVIQRCQDITNAATIQCDG